MEFLLDNFNFLDYYPKSLLLPKTQTFQEGLLFWFKGGDEFMAQDTDKIPLTQTGLSELKEELDRIKKDKRPRVVKQLEEARREGDLSENTAYTQTREELAFIDGRIEELEEVIGRALVIEKKDQCDAVELGCQVTVKMDGQKTVFSLVGEWEANPTAQKISYKSPLGQSLMGKKVGEKVEVEAPVGKITYTIIKID